MVCEVDLFWTALPCVAVGSRIPSRMHGQGVSSNPLDTPFLRPNDSEKV